MQPSRRKRFLQKTVKKAVLLACSAYFCAVPASRKFKAKGFWFIEWTESPLNRQNVEKGFSKVFNKFGPKFQKIKWTGQEVADRCI